MQDRDTPVVLSTNDMPLSDSIHEGRVCMSEGKHMRHPIQHRLTIKTSGLTFPQPIPISTPGMSTESDGCTSSSSVSDAMSYFAPSTTTSVTSVDCLPQSDMCVLLATVYVRYPQFDLRGVKLHSPRPLQIPSRLNPIFSPPLLTSTFRPSYSCALG